MCPGAPGPRGLRECVELTLLEHSRLRLREVRSGVCIMVWEVRGDKQKCECGTNKKAQQALFLQGTQEPSNRAFAPHFLFVMPLSLFASC